MKKVMNVLIVLSMLGFGGIHAEADQSWEPVVRDASFSTWVSMSFLDQNPDEYFFATQNQVVKSHGTQQIRKIIWEFPNIQKLFQDEKRSDELFIMTEKQIIQGHIKTQKTRTVFLASASSQTLSDFKIMPADENHWIVSAGEKLHESDDEGKTWYQINSFNPNEKVVKLLLDEKALWVLCEESLYFSEDLIHFKKIFSDSFAKDDVESESDFSEEDINILQSFTDIAILKNKVYVAAHRRIFVIDRNSFKISQLSQAGFREPKVYKLVAHRPQTLLASSKTGIYLFKTDEQRWEELFQGLLRNEILDLQIDAKNERVLVLTKEGILAYELLSNSMMTKKDTALSLKDLKRKFRSEPTARELQKAVLDYTGLKKEKIKNWHKQSRLKSLLPTFSFGKDYSSGNNIDLDRGSTSTPDVYIYGPDEIDRGWDMNLSWDFGDLIWSSSQTSIDSRDKLMIDQRQDLLSEATRIFYERRRLQIDLISTKNEEVAQQLQTELRVEELTSLLDAMTGGYFSSHLTNTLKAEKIPREISI